MNLVKSAYAVIKNPTVPFTENGVAEPISAFSKIMQVTIGIFLVVGVIYFMWFLFMSGYHWIDSQGDPKKYEQAKNELTYGVIGLGVIFSVFAILRFIGIVFGITGLSVLELTIPSL